MIIGTTCGFAWEKASAGARPPEAMSGMRPYAVPIKEA